MLIDPSHLDKSSDEYWTLKGAELLGKKVRGARYSRIEYAKVICELKKRGLEIRI